MADLLDPKGTHAQGTLFLEGFLDQIGCGHLKSKLPGAHIEVKNELPITECGRLDIIVRCFTHRITHFILVVENKIKSGEGDGGEEGFRQLGKYKRWLDKQATELDGQILIFLTIHAEQASIAEAQPMGYLRDVRPWFRRCLELVQAPRVGETIRQYLEIVEELRTLRKERIDGDG